ncbi:MAG: HAMP domain-containing sensor histidine kinase, partial [Hyphomonadaceae bacterium]
QVNFSLDARAPDASIVKIEVEGRVARFGPDHILLVGYNRDDNRKIVDRITQAVYTAAPIGLVLSLLGGVLISRYAARRAETLAMTAEAVMAGDLAQRVPVSGSGDEFDRLAVRMNAMLERIETLMQSARHTGDAIAHDLRSPLSRLRNRLVSALAEPLTREAAEEALGNTLEELDLVLTTFNAILRLSRLEAGEGGRMIRLEVSEVAAELADLYEPACEAAELKFTTKISKGLWIMGERELIAQAISNLLDNAVKYTPAGGAIEFSVKRGDERFVALTVLDSGPGIPQEARGQAVKRFVRLDASRSAPGSGLGLSLVAAVADAHHGLFELLDAKGPPERPGLKAILSLPRAK